MKPFDLGPLDEAPPPMVTLEPVVSETVLVVAPVAFETVLMAVPVLFETEQVMLETFLLGLLEFESPLVIAEFDEL